MKANYTITEACCAKPDMFVSDYAKHKQPWNCLSPATQIVNRHCKKCGSHWHGPVGAVKRFTRAQWDRWLVAA